MKKSFQDIMEEYKALPFVERHLMRRAAADSLVENGAEEVGSSDVNHEMVSLYKQYGSFDMVLDVHYPCAV
jgi:hypothetical protein